MKPQKVIMSAWEDDDNENKILKKHSGFLATIGSTF